VGAVLHWEIVNGGSVASPATAASPPSTASERHPGAPGAAHVSSRCRCYGDPKFAGKRAAIVGDRSVAVGAVAKGLKKLKSGEEP
jgi:hypothetical protein